jgi:hypothetical protein
MCNVQLLLEDVDFSGVRSRPGKPSSLIKWFAPDSDRGNPMGPVYLAKDSSLGGHGSIVSPYLNGFRCRRPD